MVRKKETAQQKKPAHKLPQTWEKLKERRIKKLRAEINFSMDNMVSCRIPMATLKADVKKFKRQHNKLFLKIVKCYIRPVCFKYSKVWFYPEISVCQFAPPLNLSPVETEIIDVEFPKLLRKGLIISTTREPNDYVSGIFTRTKKDGNYGMIINLKTFTKLLKFKHCKLESIEDAPDLITQDCYFGSVDLKDAYYSIPIHENYQKISEIVLEGRILSIYCPSQRIFTSCKM